MPAFARKYSVRCGIVLLSLPVWLLLFISLRAEGQNGPVATRRDDAVDVRIFQLRFLDAAEIAKIVNEVFGSGPSNGPGTQLESTGRFKCAVSETTTNALVVAADQQMLQRVSDFIDHLGPGGDIPAETQVFKLHRAKPSITAALLKAIFGQSGKFNHEVFTAVGEDQSRTLVVNAYSELMKLVRELVKALESDDLPSSTTRNAAGPNAEFQVRTFQMKYLDAGKAQSIVEKLYRPKLLSTDAVVDSTSPSIGRLASLAAEEQKNCLIVVADDVALQTIHTLIDQLDSGIVEVSEIHIFELQKCKASNAAKLLRKLLVPMKGDPGYLVGQAIRIAAEDQTNTLVVHASAEDIKLAKTLVDNLEKSPRATTTPSQKSSDSRGHGGC